MKVSFLFVAMWGVSCATTRPEGAPAPAVNTAAANPTVALYDSGSVSLREAEQRAKSDLVKVEQRLYELRTEAAERVAVEVMLKRAADRDGMTEEAWLQKRVGAIEVPPDAQLERLFERVRKRLPESTTFAEAREYLAEAAVSEERTQRLTTIFEELKNQNHYRVVLTAPERPRKTVSSLGPSRGPADAPIVIVEFADFQCPYCSRAAEVIEQVVAAYPGKVRFVFRHYPLSFHALAPGAAKASICADQQKQFWAVHDLLFTGGSIEPAALRNVAEGLKLDMKQFDACLTSAQTRKTLDVDLAEGQRLGVDGTPAFFINGVMLSGARPASDFKKVIDAELLKIGTH